MNNSTALDRAVYWITFQSSRYNAATLKPTRSLVRYKQSIFYFIFMGPFAKGYAYDGI